MGGDGVGGSGQKGCRSKTGLKLKISVGESSGFLALKDPIRMFQNYINIFFELSGGR